MPERQRPYVPRHSSRQKVVGYRAAHHRIDRERGKAREYPCADGCGNQADEWALIPGSPDLLWEEKRETGTPRPYSLDVYAYVPLARRCHRLMDDSMPPPRWKNA